MICQLQNHSTANRVMRSNRAIGKTGGSVLPDLGKLIVEHVLELRGDSLSGHLQHIAQAHDLQHLSHEIGRASCRERV